MTSFISGVSGGDGGNAPDAGAAADDAAETELALCGDFGTSGAGNGENCGCSLSRDDDGDASAAADALSLPPERRFRRPGVRAPELLGLAAPGLARAATGELLGSDVLIIRRLLRGGVETLAGAVAPAAVGALPRHFAT
jgi:hypothetical protein